MGDKIIITERETLETRITIEIRVGHMRDKIETEEMIEALVTGDQDQVQEQLPIGIGIRCLEYREDNHFARDCPLTLVNREVEQIQQMFNMDKDQTILQTPLMDVDQVRR